MSFCFFYVLLFLRICNHLLVCTFVNNMGNTFLYEKVPKKEFLGLSKSYESSVY